MKDAHKNADVAAIDTAINNLNQVLQTASAQMYQQAGAAQPGTNPGDAGFNGSGAGFNGAGSGFNGSGAGFNGGAQTGPDTNQGSKPDDNIQDADFEEVR